MKGDDRLFEALFRKYYRRVYRFFRGAGIRDDDDAHDLAQQTFTNMYKTFAQYRGEAEWTFIETVARNQLLNWYRARKTAKRDGIVTRIDEIDPRKQPHSVEPDLAETQQTMMQRASLWAAIGELPERQRQCIELWLGDIKYEAIAKTLGITIDSVKSGIRDAKRALHDKLGASLPEDEE